ncbi:hypothetical protein DL96DRAFT_599155 [Flagelloscypha sp. PMI_526]|nr:hypothetical protein DL96DRAFT_599155 [Flagelloscypha sp. PMI_526]
MPTTFNDASQPTSARYEITPTLIASLEQKRVELSTTLREIASLRQKEENLRTYITSTESLLLRIQPKSLAAVFATPELMRLTFSFTQSSDFISHLSVCDSIFYGQKESRHQPPPFTIATVCQQWRQIALAMPTLWSRIIIHTSGHSRATSAPYLRRLDLYLIRSAGQPLTISIEGAKQDVVLPFLFRLRAHEERWKAVRLEISLNLIETFLPLSSSILEALELSHGHLHYGEADLLDPPEYIVTQLKPSIRSLSVDTSWVFMGAGFPWQHLRTLRVNPGCRTLPMGVFEWCRQLEFLSITQEADFRASQQPLGRDVVHTRLERLQLMDCQEVLVFQELSLPSPFAEIRRYFLR